MKHTAIIVKNTLEMLKKYERSDSFVRMNVILRAV